MTATTGTLELPTPEARSFNAELVKLMDVVMAIGGEWIKCAPYTSETMVQNLADLDDATKDFFNASWRLEAR